MKQKVMNESQKLKCKQLGFNPEFIEDNYLCLLRYSPQSIEILQLGINAIHSFPNNTASSELAEICKTSLQWVPNTYWKQQVLEWEKKCLALGVMEDEINPNAIQVIIDSLIGIPVKVWSSLNFSSKLLLITGLFQKPEFQGDGTGTSNTTVCIKYKDLNSEYFEKEELREEIHEHTRQCSECAKKLRDFVDMHLPRITTNPKTMKMAKEAYQQIKPLLEKD